MLPSDKTCEPLDMKAQQTTVNGREMSGVDDTSKHHHHLRRADRVFRLPDRNKPSVLNTMEREQKRTKSPLRKFNMNANIQGPGMLCKTDWRTIT